jgi:hypothetical protein
MPDFVVSFTATCVAWPRYRLTIVRDGKYGAQRSHRKQSKPGCFRNRASF